MSKQHLQPVAKKRNPRWSHARKVEAWKRRVGAVDEDNGEAEPRESRKRTLEEHMQELSTALATFQEARKQELEQGPGADTTGEARSWMLRALSMILRKHMETTVRSFATTCVFMIGPLT